MKDIIQADLDFNEDRTSVLKEYFARYLKQVRNLSDRSVNHYYDALNNISRRLRAKGLVKNDIYEIKTQDELDNVREILFADPDFIIANERGRRMYSAGLNNYLRFASGADFATSEDSVEKMDMPIEKEEPILIERAEWKRSNILRRQSIAAAGYQCDFDSSHQSFIAEKTKKPYMEGHHALPMSLQGHFDTSLDVYANIVCLCPICHRKIHYGLKSERQAMVGKIYGERADRLAKSGIRLSLDEFTDLTFETAGNAAV